MIQLNSLPRRSRHWASTTMIRIATQRLERRATLQQAGDTVDLPYVDHAVDQFVATYVFDLVPETAVHFPAE